MRGAVAAMDGATWSEVEPVFASVLEERGCGMPDEDTARKAVADDLLRRMVVGALAPEAATARLRDLAWTAPAGPALEDLGVFDHLTMDWRYAEDAGWDLDALRAEMVREGGKLLARGGVRVSSPGSRIA